MDKCLSCGKSNSKPTTIPHFMELAFEPKPHRGSKYGESGEWNGYMPMPKGCMSLNPVLKTKYHEVSVCYKEECKKYLYDISMVFDQHKLTTYNLIEKIPRPAPDGF